MDWLLLLQQAGLPVITAVDNTTLPHLPLKVIATFSRTLTPAEYMIFLRVTDPVEYKKRNSRDTARNIPSYATWTQAEWQTYFDANLSDTEVNNVTTIALARVALKRQNLVIQNLVKMVLAMRDEIWNDL